MTKRRRVLLTVLVVVLAGSAFGVYAVRHAERARVSQCVSAYLNALTQAVKALDSAPLKSAAMPREIGRVDDYLILLRGTHTSIEAQLLGFDLRDIESTDSTTTVFVHERWREVARDTRTGLVQGNPVDRDQTIKYTLVSEGGILRVYLTEIVEAGSR